MSYDERINIKAAMEQMIHHTIEGQPQKMPPASRLDLFDWRMKPK
jgi:hypothetical protein